ncbi:PTS lactose/cellobiose transporter subunit IIA [Caproiciproducens sp. MSJ-32]|uniref:PTS lactose/cellobiose transporter subunit IIA n=1 Tax=Caproiciproducens sp. MSJ-32 TaxID=2841527 RepID=UPI001C108C0B|nr:PTS lactose/cellobiose transporter subunit IIA [Caproiciproducens sp. MSJ-32]MBU5455851.1 PTS lactose/cellobiose transporter subunit IIA [Caproiciproducens sp. MSJ-32]
MEDLESVAFGIITFSGDGRSYAIEAIREAKNGNIEQAEELMKKCGEAFTMAHNMQTELLTKEAQGDKVKLDLLFVHAQDHLMTGLTVRQLAEEIIDLRKDLIKVINKN